MPREEYRLPFGKHKGAKLSVLVKTNFQYVLWLSGRHLEWNKDRTYNVVDQCAKKIGTASRYKNCDCPEKPEHLVDCLGHYAGETVEDTARLINERLDVFDFPKFGYAKAWMVVNRNHPEATRAAADLIDTKRLCWACGKKLQAIGNARKNGAHHDDWNTRALHKKCLKGRK
jgi:hypothetical protein